MLQEDDDGTMLNKGWLGDVGHLLTFLVLARRNPVLE
jgi:hypothetical protein